jgi:hypothetical protein
MYELLLRTETLLTSLRPPVLLGIGAVAVAIGLIFWLGGTRYSTAIIGLLGAVIGAVAGLTASHRFGVHPWLSILVGAVVVAVLAILLKKVLVLVLAVLILSAVSGAGYVSVVLDCTTAPPSSAAAQQITVYQPFLRMAPEARLEYVDRISNQSQTFLDRLKALFDDTWTAVKPHNTIALIATIAGAVVAVVLVWLIAKIITALAYSIVGVAALFVGLQAALLAVDVHAVSDLNPRPWLLPVIFLVLVVIGWVCQLFFWRSVKVQQEPEEVRKGSHKR